MVVLSLILVGCFVLMAVSSDGEDGASGAVVQVSSIDVDLDGDGDIDLSTPVFAPVEN